MGLLNTTSTFGPTSNSNYAGFSAIPSNHRYYENIYNRHLQSHVAGTMLRTCIK